MVNRYDATDYDDEGYVYMLPSKSGEYVKYSDYDTLLEAAKLLGAYYTNNSPANSEAVFNNPIAKNLIEGKES